MHYFGAGTSGGSQISVAHSCRRTLLHSTPNTCTNSQSVPPSRCINTARALLFAGARQVLGAVARHKITIIKHREAKQWLRRGMSCTLHAQNALAEPLTRNLFKRQQLRTRAHVVVPAGKYTTYIICKDWGPSSSSIRFVPLKNTTARHVHTRTNTRTPAHTRTHSKLNQIPCRVPTASFVLTLMTACIS